MHASSFFGKINELSHFNDVHSLSTILTILCTDAVIFGHFTVNELKNAFSMSAVDFEAKYKVPKPKPDDTNITFHCRSGMRAQNAIAILKELGYDR